MQNQLGSISPNGTQNPVIMVKDRDCNTRTVGTSRQSSRIWFGYDGYASVTEYVISRFSRITMDGDRNSHDFCRYLDLCCDYVSIYRKIDTEIRQLYRFDRSYDSRTMTMSCADILMEVSYALTERPSSTDGSKINI